MIEYVLSSSLNNCIFITEKDHLDLVYNAQKENLKYLNSSNLNHILCQLAKLQ